MALAMLFLFFSCCFGCSSVVAVAIGHCCCFVVAVFDVAIDVLLVVVK